jgi:hypothetical protein
MIVYTGNTEGGSITVLLTSGLTGLESAVWQLTIFSFICKKANPNHSNRRSAILPPLVFPGIYVVKNLFGIVLLLFQVLVLWVAISDWPSLLVDISFYSKSSSPQKLSECSRIFFWQNIMEPSMTHLWQKYLFFFCQPSKWVWLRKRLHQQCMSKHK